MRSDISYAVVGDSQASPEMYLKLQTGRWYQISLGALAAGIQLGVDGTPDLSPKSLFTPLGILAARPMGDERSPLNPDYLYDQELDLIGPPDVDNDGQTELCGDCNEADATVYRGAPELCNGRDEDCDGQVDEDWAVDTDQDGLLDCLDPCPMDAQNDQDGDGACADADPCPEDAQDLCDDPVDSPVDSEDPVVEDSSFSDSEPKDSPPEKEEEGSACGCQSGPVSMAWALLLIPWRRRRGVAV
jgi:hypothetical protein